MTLKIFIRKVLNRLLPRLITDAINQRERMQSSLMDAFRHTHVYLWNNKLTLSDDFLRQFSQMAEYVDTNMRKNYIYPYNPWCIRKMQRNVDPIVSVTVDYSTVLDSSLEELEERVRICRSIEFVADELRMIEIVRRIVTLIRVELKEANTSRSEQLDTYFNHMIDAKPETFDEALQKILFYNGLFWQAYHWHNGLGRLDLVLEEYYRRDVQSGKLTRDKAKVMLTNFVQIIGQHTRQKSMALIGDTGQYILLGGVDKEGYTVQNDLTELFLEIFTELKVPDPKLILRVNEHTSDTIWRKAVNCIITGCGSPLLMNEKLIMEGMVKFGYKKEDVWNVGTSACWEPLIIGKSFDQNNPLPNFPVINALNEVIHVGKEYVNFDSVIEDTKRNIAKQIGEIIHNITFDVSPLYSLFFDSCIERGKDYSRGGADYAYHGVQVVGLPNLVNALLNVKKYIFTQRILSLKECAEALAANYVGYEDIRKLMLSNDQRFGNAHPDVIALTNDLMEYISSVVERYTCNGEKLKIGFSSSQYIMACKQSRASLDGRKDFEPFAVHISPVSQKIDIQEVLDFAGSLNYSDNRMNGNVVDFILPSAYIKQKDKLITILQNAMTGRVYELQLNVLDAATLRDAKAHPERYPDLVVRVWGFSAYFNDLPEEYKDNLIARAEAYE